jgi:hypothetical protein
LVFFGLKINHLATLIVMPPTKNVLRPTVYLHLLAVYPTGCSKIRLESVFPPARGGAALASHPVDSQKWNRFLCSTHP